MYSQCVSCFSTPNFSGPRHGRVPYGSLRVLNKFIMRLDCMFDQKGCPSKVQKRLCKFNHFYSVAQFLCTHVVSRAPMQTQQLCQAHLCVPSPTNFNRTKPCQQQWSGGYSCIGGNPYARVWTLALARQRVRAVEVDLACKEPDHTIHLQILILGIKM